MNAHLIPSWPDIQRIFRDCLSEAELTFGPCALGWEYSVRLRQSPEYPETINDGQSQVTVWLTKGRSWIGYYYEAAHEAVHCLDPLSNYLKIGLVRKGDQTGGLVKIGESCVVVNYGKEGDSANDMGNTG